MTRIEIKDYTVNGKTIFKNQAGKRVASVSSILNMMPKPALVRWAYNRGKEGLELYGAEADIGKIAHGMIAASLSVLPYDVSVFPPEMAKQAYESFKSFNAWWEDENLAIVAAEAEIVSEELQYGGRIDFVARVQHSNRLVMGEIKTGPAIYPEARIQLAGLANLWREMAQSYGENVEPGDAFPNVQTTPQAYSIDKLVVVRVPKEEGQGFEVATYGDLRMEMSRFRLLRGLYELDKKAPDVGWLRRARLI